MSLINFYTYVDFINSATPSSGFSFAYDLDGILKQKDLNGNITPVGITCILTNTAAGISTLSSITTGDGNTGFGYNSLLDITTGNNNSAFGFQTLLANTSGTSSVAIGYNALLNNTTGSQNTAIGYNTALGIATGSNNTIIGSNVTGLASGISNNVILADGSGIIRMHVLANGNTGFGTSDPNAKVDISDLTGTASPLLRAQGTSGELFTIYDSLTGSLFSVNNISGLPVLEVFSDNSLLMGSYLAPSFNTTSKTTVAVGTTTICSIPFAIYTGGFFEYTISDGTNKRSGSIMYVCDGSSITSTETPTTDIGNTEDFTFTVTISGANAVLSGVSAVGTWTVKTIIKSI